MVSAIDYFNTANLIMQRLVRAELSHIRTSAQMIAKSILNEGIIQVFGTGHSEAFSAEIARRAGGIVPANKISLRDIVFFGEDHPSAILEAPVKLERDPSVSQRLYELSSPHQNDIFILASNSGINSSVIEMARIVKANGHKLIAVTSRRHSEQEASRHASGKRLFELSDITIDNGAPPGDAILEIANGTRVCAVSTITSTLIAEMMIAELIGILEEAGHSVPIWISANLHGADEHNSLMQQRYGSRVRRNA